MPVPTSPYNMSSEDVTIKFLTAKGYTAGSTVETPISGHLIQVATIGGSVNPYIPRRVPVLRLSVLVPPTDVDTPAWGKAKAIAEELYLMLFDPSVANFLVDSGSASYRDARVQYMNPLSEPLRVGEQSNIARYDMDIEVSFVSLA